MLPLVTPKSVSRLVTRKVIVRPAWKMMLLVTRLAALMEISPPAVMEPLVRVVVSESKVNEPTQFEIAPELSKFFAQMVEPWSDSRPRFTKFSYGTKAVGVMFVV